MKDKILKGCITFLCVYAGTTVLYFLILQFYSANPYNLYLALFGAIFTLIFFGGLRSLLVPGAEEKAVKKYADSPDYSDGDYVAAIGPIHAVGETLISPLQRQECVCYEYDIYRMVTESSNDSSHKKSDFIGFARTPAVIKTPTGDIRLKGFIDLEHFPKRKLKYGSIRDSATDFISKTKFDTFKSGFAEGLPQIEELLKDRRDTVRSDRRDPAAELGPGHTITERCVEVGREVCALGIYSGKDDSLISDFESEGLIAQLIPGNSGQALRLLRRKKYQLFSGALLAFLVSHGLLYYVVRHFLP